MTKEERDHLARVKSMCCAVCAFPQVEVHHAINLGHKKRDHFRTVPLCKNHHTGAFSIHATRKSFRERYGHEDNMIVPRLNPSQEKS